MNETIKVLKTRRSIRSFKEEQVREEELNQILEAGMYAPSARGLQTAIIVAIQDKNLINKIRKMNASFTDNPENDPFYGAPTIVIVLGDSTQENYVQDGSLVMGNLMNAAHSLEVDSCWINRAKEVFDTQEGKALLKAWGIDEKYAGIGNCILGYRDSEYPEPVERKENYIIKL